jgi:hypothetical protein
MEKRCYLKPPNKREIEKKKINKQREDNFAIHQNLPNIYEIV